MPTGKPLKKGKQQRGWRLHAGGFTFPLCRVGESTHPTSSADYREPSKTNPGQPLMYRSVASPTGLYVAPLSSVLRYL